MNGFSEFLLFAHHVEPHHIPVLAVLLGVGVWAGWHAAGNILRRH